MKILEDWGTKKIQIFYKYLQKNPTKFTSATELFKSKKLIYFSAIAFMIGFVLTIPIIYIELKFDIFNIDDMNMENILFYVFIFTVLVFFEFYLLFLLGFHMIAYYIYNFYHINNRVMSDVTEKEFLGMLSRTIMELPEKSEEKYNIGHHKNQNVDLIAIGILYKLKVVVSNLLLKLLARRVLARTAFRLYTPYIAAVGTGVWDAIIFYKTIKHSQYKIMVRYTILLLLDRKKDELMKSENVKAILLRYHHYSEYNNNFDFLLSEIHKETSFNYEKESFLEEDVRSKCNQKLLLLLYSFKEKMHTKEENEKVRGIWDSDLLKEIRTALKNGDTAYLESFIEGM